MKRNHFWQTTICSVLLICAGSVPAQAQEISEQANLARIGAFISHVNPHLPNQTDRAYARQALVAAQAAHIDPCLLLAVVSVESSWRADAVSQHGAIGLGQLKPLTAASLKANPYSVGDNLRATSLYLRSLLKRFSSIQPADPTNSHTAIAAYQQGPSAVAHAMAVNGNQLPTSIAGSYVRRVVSMWQAARSRLGSTLAVHAHERNDLPLTSRAILVAEADLHSAAATRKPILISDERTYWGITDLGANQADSLFSSAADGPGTLLLERGI